MISEEENLKGKNPPKARSTGKIFPPTNHDKRPGALEVTNLYLTFFYYLPYFSLLFALEVTSKVLLPPPLPSLSLQKKKKKKTMHFLMCLW